MRGTVQVAQPRLCPDLILTQEQHIKRVLVLLDNNPVVGVFDAVMALDGGVDHVLPLGGVKAHDARRIACDLIFSRPPDELAQLAVHVGGSDISEGEATLQALKAVFFGPMRVSVMLDSNGCNTTAAATVARICSVVDVSGRKAVVLAGTGPVGRRIATLLALQEADVTICSRDLSRATDAARSASARAGITVHPAQYTAAQAPALLKGAHIISAAGAPGVQLLPESVWRASETLQVLTDINAVPPYGVEQLEPTSNGERHGDVYLFGALGIGSLKKQVHYACLRQLFERNDRVFDLEQIYTIATDLQPRCAS